MVRTKKGPALKRMTFWVPLQQINDLLKQESKAKTPSELVRLLIDEELERKKSWEAHTRGAGKLSQKDFDDRFF
jgi:hypothetical protein